MGAGNKEVVMVARTAHKEASADAGSEGVTGAAAGNLRWKRPRLLEIRDVSLFVEVVGDGYPVVLMHGGPAQITTRCCRSGSWRTGSP
jgi:hypothetical protein